MVIKNIDRDKQRSHDSDGRFYHWKDEPPRISVTNAIKNGTPAPGLIGGGRKQTAIGALEMHDLIHELVRDETFVAGPDDKPLGPGGQSAYRMMWKYVTEKWELARDNGTAVHDMLEAKLLDMPVPDPVNETVEAMYRQGVAFLEQVKPKVIAAEAIVYNREFGYAGTLDAVLRIDKQNVLTDWKTGKRVYPESALQLNALANCEFVGLDSGEELPLPSIDSAAIVHLRPEEWSLVPIVLHPVHFGTFLAALQVAEWSRKDARGSVLKPTMGGRRR